MNDNLNIKRLWHYLRIQDEILIVQVYNSAKDSNEFIVADMVGNELKISVVDSLSDIPLDKPLRIIRQRDENGRYEIPSVDSLKYDKLVDY